jgi:hypothetical protein
MMTLISSGTFLPPVDTLSRFIAIFSTYKKGQIIQQRPNNGCGKIADIG